MSGVRVGMGFEDGFRAQGLGMSQRLFRVEKLKLTAYRLIYSLLKNSPPKMKDNTPHAADTEGISLGGVLRQSVVLLLGCVSLSLTPL